ncbi:MAG TPA: hypothetical protein VGN16_09770 [Acidobacteriaceae bacterium]
MTDHTNFAVGTAAKRWAVSIDFRTAEGTKTDKYELYELSTLAGIVEQGSHWDCIEGIQIRRINHITSPTLTVEESIKL